MRKREYPQQPPIIGICGAGTCDEATAALAEDVGRAIAERGAWLVCGGLGGVMEAACRGAAQHGGFTIGVLPTDDATAANPHVHLAIPTGMGHARNVILVQTAHVIIAISGGYGTLSEIAIARKNGRHVVGLQTWDLGTSSEGHHHIHSVSTASDAVSRALELCSHP